MSVTRTAAFRTLMGIVPLGLALFLSAGDLRWTGAWCYIGVTILSSLLMLFGPLRLDEDLIEERLRPKAGSKRWDRIFVALVAVFSLAELVVPGLDRRFGWTRGFRGWEFWLGLGLTIAGTAGLMWAMRANRFFSTFIRIQTDRGHHVVQSGPYRAVRHPGYALWTLRALGVPLLLGSHWTYAVTIPFVLMFVARTALEDRVLRNELDGYQEYAARVRWRLAPGIW